MRTATCPGSPAYAPPTSPNSPPMTGRCKCRCSTPTTYARPDARIDNGAALDGIYVIRTRVTPTHLHPTGVVVAYKSLAGLERDWRNIKTDNVDLRLTPHSHTARVEGHLLICMLAQ